MLREKKSIHLDARTISVSYDGAPLPKDFSMAERFECYLLAGGVKIPTEQELIQIIRSRR